MRGGVTTSYWGSPWNCFIFIFLFSVWRMHVKPFLACLNESSGTAVALHMAMALFVC